MGISFRTIFLPWKSTYLSFCWWLNCGITRHSKCQSHIQAEFPQILLAWPIKLVVNDGTRICQSRWWFQIFFIFILTRGTDPIWRSYFSNGLVQPPTCFFFLETLPASFLPSTKQQQKHHEQYRVVVSNIVYFHPYLGEMIQFDDHIFHNGLVQPPTRISLHPWGVFVLFWSEKLQAFQAFVKGTKMQSINVWELKFVANCLDQPQKPQNANGLKV